MNGGTAWPNVLADLVAKRDALNGVIDTIRTNFVSDDNPNEMPESPAPKSRRTGKRPGPKPGRKKRIEKRQTDRQTEQRAGRRAPRSLPDDSRSAAILEQIRSHGGSIKPGELAHKLKVEVVTVRAWMKPLLKSKAVIATGATMSRRYSLPGRGPKEDL